MKYKSLLALAAASLTMVFACQKPVELAEEISLSPAATSYEFPEEGGEYTIELTATVDWSLQGYDAEVQKWLSVNPSSGAASDSPQTVTIKALANGGANRQADLVFYGNIMHKAGLTIIQKGPEGEGASITIAEFIERADTENEYVLTGVVGDIATSARYWGFSLKDDTGTISCPFIGENSDEFKAMGIHTGDEVSIRGVYKFYTDKQQHQLSDGVVEKHTALDPAAVKTVTVAEFLDAKDKFAMYRMTGTVTGDINADFASFDLKDESGTVYVYTVNNASEYGSRLKAGDKVTLRGAYTEYNGKDEVVDCTIESLEPGQGGDPDEPATEPTSATPVTIAEFLDKTVNNTDWYELTGEIISIENGNAYGNFTIQDNTGSVYIYGMVKAWAGGKNDQSFNEIGVEIGDVVTLWTLRAEHNGNPQGGGSNPAIYKSHEDGEAVTYPEGTAYLTFPDGNQKSVNNYTSEWQAIVGDYTYTLVNFNNNQNQWAYVKCGRKADPSVASISNDTPMPEITAIEVTADQLKADKVNSIELSIYSGAGQQTLVADGIEADGALAAGILNFEIPEEYQAEGQYYKLTFDCAVAGDNGPVQISKVTYIAAE